MERLIFGYPICIRHECTHNDPQYPNNCEIIDCVDTCCMADVKHPRRVQKILSWVDRHWLRLAISLIILSLIILWSLFIFNAGSESAIMNLRSLQESEIKNMEAQIKPAAWKHLYRKHGHQTVIFEPGKSPYYVNARGERCQFI